MDTVEIIVYLGIAVILVGILTIFLSTWEVGDQSQSLLDIVFGSEKNTTPSFATATLDELAIQLKTFKATCNATTPATNTTQNTASVYVTGNETLNATTLFSRVKALHWCGSLQSASEGCGEREDVNVSAIPLPAVVTLTCTNGTITITG